MRVITACRCIDAGIRENGITYATLLPIAGGVVIASGGEPAFSVIGFTSCLLATAGRALKSVVQVRVPAGSCGRTCAEH